MKVLDLENWDRKQHFEFFNGLDNPFWGVVSKVDLSKAKKHCKEQGYSLYLYYMHAVLTAINSVENLKTRIQDDQIVSFESINISPTVFREDKSFGFSYMDFHPDFELFEKKAKTIIQDVQSTRGLNFTDDAIRTDVIHFSALPWIDFSDLSHARSFAKNQSVPRVSVGKIVEELGVYKMSVSLEMHHGLADGYHAGLFFESLQVNLDSKT